MTIPDPCCGMSLQKATRILAIIQIVYACIQIALIVIVFVVYNDDLADDSNLVLGIGLVLPGLGLVVAIVLLLGANQKNLLKCWVWLGFNVVLLLLIVASIIIVVAGSPDPILIAIEGVEVLIRLYMLWVVLAFMGEIKRVAMAEAARF